MDKEEYIGYLKYKGKTVEDGLIDARKAAQALLGFDEAVRFFVSQQSSALKEIDFEIPIRIKKGSWEALIPHTVVDWILVAFKIGATTYVGTAAKKMAENDFDKKKLKDVFIHAIEAVQWVIRIGKHLGVVTKKKFDGTRFRKENTEIGIPNEKGEYLYVPKRYLEFYVSASPKLLKRITEPVEVERKLEIGVYKNGKVVVEQVSCEQKHIFILESEEDEGVLFPELEHGQLVELEGHISRGNDSANTLGFKYKGHTLNCHPDSGSVVRFKGSLFLHCRIRGKISRSDKYGEYNELKPKIIVSNIESLELDDDNRTLF